MQKQENKIKRDENRNQSIETELTDIRITILIYINVQNLHRDMENMRKTNRNLLT